VYSIQYADVVVKENIPDLPASLRPVIQRAIKERLAVDPIGFGKPLQYNYKGYRRLRVGKYRVVYRIDNSSHTVIIAAIKHRKDIYEG
jgi:mRNA interferase RelE/StbE